MQDDGNPTTPKAHSSGLMQRPDGTRISRPVAYGLLATAAIGTGALALTTPQALAAGMGSVSSSAATFFSPVWRFVKRVNELYVDTGIYMREDRAWLLKKIGRPVQPPAADKVPAKPHKHVFSRPVAYGIMATTALAAGFIGFVAPTVLAAALGSVTVSAASFTKPVIDLIESVNHVYNDTYDYLKKDVFHAKMKRPELIPVEPVNEIDLSIYAPITEARTPYTKLQTYGILALGALGIGVLAVHAPAVLIAALGTIAGSAISYTSPALQLMKKFNSVYDKAENHVIEDLDIGEALGLKPEGPQVKAKGPNLPKPVSYLIMGGIFIGTGVVAFYAPSVLTAALGAIAGGASSFTEPVMKQVGRVNDFYIDAASHLRADWNKAAGRKPAAQPTLQKTPEPAAGKILPAEQLRMAQEPENRAAPEQLTRSKPANDFNRLAPPDEEHEAAPAEKPQASPAQKPQATSAEKTKAQPTKLKTFRAKP